MKLIITAEIDADEIDGVPEEEITAQLRHELDGYEFWTPATQNDGCALFAVKVTVQDDAMIEAAAKAAQAARAARMVNGNTSPWEEIRDEIRENWRAAQRAAFETVNK